MTFLLEVKIAGFGPQPLENKEDDDTEKGKRVIFFMVLSVGLQSVIVVFPDHTDLLSVINDCMHTLNQVNSFRAA